MAIITIILLLIIELVSPPPSSPPIIDNIDKGVILSAINRNGDKSISNLPIIDYDSNAIILIYKEDAATAPGLFRPCLGVNTLGLPKITESP